MCWNFEVSLLTGISCWIVGLYLIWRNVRWDRANGIWLMAATAIQFADAILWWDGMDIISCSNTNWITSSFLIPIIIFSHWILRHIHTKFAAVKWTLYAITVTGILLHLLMPAELGPFGSIQFFIFTLQGACSIQPEKARSPLWFGLEPPLFHHILYLYLVSFPLFLSDRYPEAIVLTSSLIYTLAFKDEAYASQWCGLAFIFAFWYLAYSGPELPTYLQLKNRSKNTKDLSLPEKYYFWLYGTAFEKGKAPTRFPALADFISVFVYRLYLFSSFVVVIFALNRVFI